MSLNTLSANPDIMRENYDVLASELESLLSQPSELFTRLGHSDVLSILQGKMDNIRVNYDIDYDGQQELRSLEEDINGTILNTFKKEFVDHADTIDTEFSDSSLKGVAAFIYQYLYIGRKDLLLNYLLEYTLTNRAAIAKRYKTNDSKKDITYQAIRAELVIRNPDYYILIMHSHSICEDVLFDEELDLLEVFELTDMSEDESDITERLFEYNGTLAMQTLSNSLKDSAYFNDFKNTFKSRLSDVIKNLN